MINYIHLSLFQTFHSIPVVSGCQDAFQENRGVPDMCQAKKCLPDLHPRPGIRPSDSGNSFSFCIGIFYNSYYNVNK
jgi:hypothetical protein